MSDSYYLEQTVDSPWMKLYFYLRFKILSEGLWINSEPGLWFEAIMNHGIAITEVIDGDTGAPLNRYSISVRRKHSPDVAIFGISLYYDAKAFIGRVFAKRLEEVYNYIRDYSDASGWLNSARELHKLYLHEERYTLSIERWNEVFGPFDNTGSAEIKFFKFVEVHPLLPRIFGLLASLQNYSSLIKDVSFEDAVHKNMGQAKEWALFALLDMLRYYCTAT
jgi:hypothetical protein